MEAVGSFLLEFSITNNLSTCIALTLGIYLCYKYRQSWTIYYDETSFGVERGCLPVEVKAPYRLPLSLDLVWKGFKANADQKLLALFSEFYNELGPNIEQTLMGATGFVTMDPDNVETILSSKFSDFGFGPRRSAFWSLLGEGIFTQEGAPWKHSRELLRRQFVRMQYQNLDVLQIHVENLINALHRSPDLVDMQPLFFRFTLDTTTALIFGQSVYSLNQENEDSFSASFSYASNVSAMRLRLGDVYWLHTPIRFLRACRVTKAYADDYVRNALSSIKPEVTSQTKNLESPFAFIEELHRDLQNPANVRDHLVNVLLAGRDTTACLMTWAIRLLVRHPECLARLQNQIADVLGDEQNVTRNHIRQMPYLQHVIDETLRLYPSVPINLRFANSTTVLPRGGGPTGTAPVLIRRGMAVTYSPYHMQRRKDLWGADANEFRPDRWEEPGLRNKPWFKWGYLPFNGGPRVCLGKDLALTEASYGIARVVQTFSKLRMPKGEELEAPGTERQALTLVLASADGCRVMLR